MRSALLLAFLLSPLSFVYAQTPGPQFEVVSIKRNAGSTLGSNGTQRPDGGFTYLNVPIGTLISRAYAPAVPADMVALPDWAMRERYDVSATSSVSRPTPDEQTAMLRAMLAERLRLVAHMENREQPVYDLVLARSDRQLGPNIKPTDVDCAAIRAAQRAAADAARAAGTVPPRPPLPDLNGPTIPPCTFRMGGNRMEASATTMEAFVQLLRPAAGRLVVDKTGLSGSYQVSLTFDRMAGLRGPDTAPSNDAPSVFTAVQEQLGLKLESSRASRDTLVIDHIERPSEN